MFLVFEAIFYKQRFLLQIMKKEIVLIGFLLILLAEIVFASEVFDVGLKVEEHSNEGFLQNTKEFLFGWLVEDVFMEGKGIDYGVKLECSEKCGICEKCVSLEEYFEIYDVEEGAMTEKMDFSNLKNTFGLLNTLSRGVQDLAFEFIGQKFEGLLFIAGTPQMLFGQMRGNPLKGTGAEEPISEETILVPLGEFPSKNPSRIRMIIPNIQNPTCIPDAECEREKKICPEYSNKKRVDLYCNPQKYPDKYICWTDKEGLCQSNNFVIDSINGIDSGSALKECCQWAWKLEHEKCKQETDLSIQEFGKQNFQGGNYNGQRLTGHININFQNKGNPSSNSVHSGWNNEITFTGSRDEIANDLIPGDIASFIINKGFVNEAPPWLYKGLSYTFASDGADGKKCEYFKELVKIKDKINLKETLGEWNPAEIDSESSLTGYALIEFLMSKGSRYYEKDIYYQKFMLYTVFDAFKQKESGDRTWHSWENALLKDPTNTYNIKSIEDAERQLKDWINSQLGPNGEIDTEGVINPCTCILREEVK